MGILSTGFVGARTYKSSGLIGLGGDLSCFFKVNRTPDQFIGMLEVQLFFDALPVGADGFDA